MRCKAVVLLLGTFALAQTKPPSLDVGSVTLTLGMSREKVVEQLKNAGYNFIDLPPKDGEAIVIVTRDGTNDHIKRLVALTFNDGELHFRSGSLTRIRKRVQSEMGTDRHLAASLYAVFQQYASEGSNGRCVLGTLEEMPVGPDNPDVEAKQINIICGVGGGVYRSTIVRWATVEGAQQQVPVAVFQELWR